MENMARYVGRRSWTGLEPELFGPQCSLGFAVAVTQESAMIELGVSGLLNLEQPWWIKRSYEIPEKVMSCILIEIP